MKTFSQDIPELQTTLTVTLSQAGTDYILICRGGQAHVGTVVLAEPRPSLHGDGSRSATSSVLNALGHKDEYLCRPLAEAVASATGQRTVCTGGIHIDAITPAGLKALKEGADKLTAAILAGLGSGSF